MFGLFNNDKTPTECVSYSFNGEDKKIYGGPFFHAPVSHDYYTINLMAEYALGCDCYIPIKDFSVPANNNDFIAAFEHIITEQKDVYVGCFGGMGRTGLFMACLLKYVGEEFPLEKVREEYNPHAVETDNQKEFLDNFPVRATPVVAPSASRMGI